MSEAHDSTDYGALFEKVTGTASITEEQDRDGAGGDRAVEDDLGEYVEDTTRADGLEEAVSDPDTG